MKDEVNKDQETIIGFILDDHKDGTYNTQVATNKLTILFEQTWKELKKYYRFKFLFIGIVLGMVIVRILQFILPNA